MHERVAERCAWWVGLGGALALAGCSLESALGVDDDGGTSAATTQAMTAGSGAGPGGPGSGADEASSTTGDTDSGLPPSSCGGRGVRVATFNVETVGAEGSASFEALAAVIGRIDADVVCMQEVQFYETQSLFALAAQTGYGDVIQAQESPAIGGDHTNACISRPGLRLVGSYSGWDLSSDPQANDVGRDILVVQVDLAEGEAEACRLGVVVLHLKSGQSSLDWYRRQVEAERVSQAVGLYRAAYPGDAMLILGDFNENLGDPALGSVFREVPAGLPPSYTTGSDIALPLTYQPFVTFQGLGFSIAPATQEDSDRDATWNDSVRLDYVLQAGAPVQATEVYSSCRDNGVDDAPAGHWVPKAGDPLGCGVSEDASDHFPVVVDLVIP